MSIRQPYATMQEPDTSLTSPAANGGASHEAGESPGSPVADVGNVGLPPSSEPGGGRQSLDEATKKAVDSVLYSDIGVSTLLNRLKQSIASVKDFATFLKKRSGVEDEHAKELRRLCRLTHQDIRKADARQGTYARQFEAITSLHERMADNGLQFALNLHQMHEDLTQLAFEMEKGRKNWKQLGLSAENKATDAEKQMDKAKQKYDSLAEQYDHAKTGDSSGRHFGLRGMKSAEQREEELQNKVELADRDYQSKVQYAKSQRQELLSTSRPQAIKGLEDLITECDAGLTLQMQKFATFNERLLLGNGLLVSPLNEPNAPQQKSMRELAAQIDNQQDFQSYIRSFGVKVPARSGDIEYRQHPTLAPKGQPIRPYQPETQAPSSFSGPAAPPKDPSPTLASPPTLGERAGLPSPSGPRGPPPSHSSAPYPTPAPPAFPATGYGAHMPEVPSPISPRPESSGFVSSRDPYANSPPPPGPPAHASNPGGYGSPQQPYGRAPHSMGPVSAGPPQIGALSGLPPPKPSTRDGRRPIFGVTLNDLFQRDSSPVPLVVYQCIQAVDQFGLDNEGIYRVSGNTSQVAELKAQFTSSPDRIDFRNPEAFFHDVNNAANLLKQFFRELPDPLLTSEHYSELIEAAKIQDDVVRRDSLHAVVNALPDPNYATLRALTLHLHRVEEHSESNRMTATTLAVIFAPTLMGTQNGTMADAGLQPRVIETILQNALQIFDED